MHLKAIEEERYQDYKVPSMYLAFPSCTFKCEKECGKQVCQNGALATAPNIDISGTEIVKRYLDNPITQAIVMAGLEPFDSYEDMICLIAGFRLLKIYDPIVIYTGYRENEIPQDRLQELARQGNIILKFGRCIPDQQPHYDEIIGVNLASDNQYAKQLE